MLSFLVVTQEGGPELTRFCHRLAAVTRPGDTVTLLDAGAREDTAQRLRRFDRETGWGRQVEARMILPADPPRGGPQGWHRAVAAQPGPGWHVPLGLQDIPLASGLDALRSHLAGADPDMVLTNRAWWLGGPQGALPCPDAPRWPDAGLLTGAAARIAAATLWPDPARQLLSPALAAQAGDDPQPEDDIVHYDARLAVADSILFVPQPIALTPLPSCNLVDMLAAATRWAQGTRLPRGQDTQTELARRMQRMSDQLGLADPAEADAILTAAETWTAALPRWLRHGARSDPGPMGRLLATLHRGGADAALPRLIQHAAAEDRRRMTALAAEIDRLRDDVDLTLPGPDYLIRMHDRIRRL